MPRILWWLRAILIASSVLAEDAAAFSVGNHHPPQRAELIPLHPNTNVPAMSRRASIIGVLTVLIGTLPAVAVAAAAAATVAVEDDNCQTDCMYQCTIATSAGQTPSAKRSKETISVQNNSCLEECPNHQQCHAPPPPEMYKREPILVKAKDIVGLYPRWQDSF
jgi:hypothetical protein